MPNTAVRAAAGAQGESGSTERAASAASAKRDCDRSASPSATSAGAASGCASSTRPSCSSAASDAPLSYSAAASMKRADSGSSPPPSAAATASSGVRPRAMSEARERLDRPQEDGVLGAAAAQQLLRAVEVAGGAPDVGEARHREVRAAALRRGVRARGVAPLQAALELGDRRRVVAHRRGGDRLLEEDVGEAREEAQDLVAARARLREVPGHPQRADEPAGERRHEAVGGDVLVVADAQPRGLELVQCGDGVAGGGVLRAEVEREERAVETLGDLALEQLDVAARLLLRVADRAEVAVVVDPHVGDREALGEERGQVLGDLLVDAALEAQARAVAEDAQRVVGDGGAVLQRARCGSSPAGSGPRARSGRSGRAGARRRPRRGPRPRPGT